MDYSTSLAFGAAPDAYTDYRGFTIGFNSGMMAVRPSSTVLFESGGRQWTANKGS